MQNFIPHFIAENYADKIYNSEFKAFVMFVDISGFTSMTERLMQEGTEGAEVLALIINGIFEPVIEAVYLSGGFISTFAGDAFTAVFKDCKDPLDVLTCALRIRDIFQESGKVSSRFGYFELSVKIGLSYGNIEWGIIGTEEHKAYYFRGEAVDGSAHSEHCCEKMDIVCDSRVLLSADSKKIQTQAIDNGFHRILSCRHDIKIENPVIHSISRHILRLFVPERVLEMPPGEFREIIAVFIAYNNTGNLSELKSAVNLVIREADRYGGYFEGVDFGDKGTNSLILFGIPQTYENLAERVMGFILKLRNELKTDFRAGISSGIVFAGIKGSEYRLCYGVMGRVVNLSARLMVKAKWGQILCSPDIYRKNTGLYAFEKAGCHALKGFSEKYRLYSLKDKIKTRHNESHSGKFLGRKDETERLKELISPIFMKRLGGIIYIDGAPGVGKSRFICNFRYNIGIEKCSFLYLVCDQILRKSFNPFKTFFREYFQVSGSSSTDKFKKYYRVLIDRSADPEIKQELIRTESIIGALAGVEWENSLFSSLDAKGRYENTLLAVRNFIRSLSLLEPIVIIIDDAHLLDRDSIELIKILISNADRYPFVILALCRPNDDGSDYIIPAGRDIRTERLSICPFSREDISGLIAERLQPDKVMIPKETEGFIWERSRGNPFFAEQIILHLQENSMLDDNYNISRNISEIPSEISRIIIARIDRLSLKMKETIKSASVLGMEFSHNVLERLLKRKEIIDGYNECIEYIKEGERGQIWEIISELRYIFRHALIRDAVYEIQLKDSLRKLHNIAGEIIEELYRNTLSEHFDELAEHYHRAENSAKAIEYLKKSGDRSRQNYENKQAIEAYEKLLNYLDDIRDASAKAEIMLCRGDILELVGKWDEAVKSYKKALTLAGKSRNEILSVDCMNALGSLISRKGKSEYAARLLKKSVKTADKAGYKRGAGTAWGNLGSVYGRMTKNDDAMDCFMRQLSICEEIGYAKGISIAVGNLGIIHEIRGNFKEAMKFYKRSLAICEKINDKIGAGNALAHIGSIYLELGNHEKAMHAYNKRLLMSIEIGDKKTEGMGYGNMGIVNAILGNLDKAGSYFEKQLSILKEIGDKRGIAEATGNLGNVYRERGEFEKAMDCYQRQILLSEEVRDPMVYLGALGNMGITFAMQGKFDDAINNYCKALSIYEKMGNKHGISNALYYMGDAYYSKGEDDQALKYYERLLSIYKDMSHTNKIKGITARIEKIRERQDCKKIN